MGIKTLCVVGLDLGQQGDFSALALLQYPGGPKPTFTVPTLKRWPLGTSYRQVGRDVAKFLNAPDLADAELVIDSTGVGAAVVELVIEELARARVPAQVCQVTITGGNTASGSGRSWHVSKRVLVSNISAIVHGGRLRVAEDQPEAAQLLRELSTFRAKINIATGNESFEHWRERDKDDLVLAICIGAWWPGRPRQRVQIDTGDIGGWW